MKPLLRFYRLIPVSGTTTPEPKPEKLDWMKEIIRPSFVGRRQANGFSLSGCTESWRLSPRHVDVARPSLQIGIVEQGFELDVPRAWVADVSVRVGESQFRRLDLQVQAVRRVDGMRRQIELPQDTQCDERRNSLAVGWDLVQALAAVIDLQRVHPFRVVRRQVVGCHQPPVASAWATIFSAKSPR